MGRRPVATPHLAGAGRKPHPELVPRPGVQRAGHHRHGQRARHLVQQLPSHLLLSNLVAYAGHLVRGLFGDRFGRRNMIGIGWSIGRAVLAIMLYGPHNAVVVALYIVGLFFLIGPYSCLLSSPAKAMTTPCAVPAHPS